MESDLTNTVSSSDGLSLGNHGKRDLHGTTGPTRRSTKGQWTAEEDETLCKAVQQFKGKNWKKIAECFKDRTDVQCLHRWQKVLNPEVVKGPWTKEEDEELVRSVEQLGPKKWSIIAQRLTGRIGKQCRERWHNHLNPAIKREPWTQEEELMLIQAHKVYGNKWVELTKFLPGRSDNAIKNHWNSSVKKKLDAYLASGLLDQFQGLPCVSHTKAVIMDADNNIQSAENLNPGNSPCDMSGELDFIQYIDVDQVMDSLDQIDVDSYSVQQDEPGLLSSDPPRFPSPCRLWDSPSCVDTPEAVLESAAKAFTGMPSILKKRSRDLLSPLSEKSCGNKLQRVSFFNSSKDVSKGDTTFYENHLPLCSQTKDCGPVSEDKENVNPAGDIVQDEGGNRTTVNVQLRPGVLMEHKLDEKLCSCNKIATKLDTTPKGPHSKIAASCESQFASTIHAAGSSSAPLGTIAESPANGENSGIFGETPYKKSLESSPWLSFVPGPRVDTDITIEDFGYFSSPGE